MLPHHQIAINMYPEVMDGRRCGNSCTVDRQCAAGELMLSPTNRAPQNFRFVGVQLYLVGPHPASDGSHALHSEIDTEISLTEAGRQKPYTCVSSA